MIRKLTGAAFAGAILLSAPALAERSELRVVGSSTVYPFSSYVAEELGAITEYKAVVESTGSGGGMKLFCAGTGERTPDFTNASRRIKKSEFELCQKNGVTDITELMIGFDGIVFAQRKQNQPMGLTRKQLLMAVAAEVPVDGKLVPNPYKRWNEIDASLPDREIVIYGPPKSSGTRDAFVDMILKAQTKKMDAYGKKKYKKIRDDGVYVASGENDNLIVKKLAGNKAAFGIFGFSFLEENRDKVQASKIDGVEAQRDLISSGKYPISRSLFFYVKQAHVEKMPGMKFYVGLFLSEKMIGPDGLLKDLGLIPLPDADRAAIRKRWKAMEKLAM